MTPLSDVEAEALGRRWLAAGGGWREGMLSLDGWRVLDEWRVGAASAICVCATDGGGDGANAVETRECSAALLGVPDLRDAATRGAALEVVRERWGGDVWVQGHRYHQWGEAGWVQSGLCWYLAGFDHSDVDRVNGWRGFATEAEALVSAMEARHDL